MTTLVAAIAVVIGLLLSLPAPIGRRMLLLLAISFCPTAIAMTVTGMGTHDYTATTDSRALMYLLPTLALACLVAVLAWRSHRGSAA